jgi:tetratricopeptide (TPR) repeat protein
MAYSSLKRLWNAVKLPAPVPRRPWDGPPRRPSGLKRLWNAIKPPPAIQRPDQGASREERLKRRGLLWGSAALVLVGAAAWGVYLYIASAPMRAEKVFNDGMRLMGSGDYRGAEARFTDALRIWPQLTAGYMERGLARKNMNQMDAAIEDFEHTISQDSNLAPAHNALGLIFREHGDLTRAMNEFTVSIELSPNTDAFYQRGQLHELLGQHVQAIQDYDAAIHEQPDAPDIYRARALSKDALGDHEGSQQDRRAALHIEHR